MKKKNIFVTFLFCMMVLCPKGIFAATSTPTFGHKTTWNIENMYYYLADDSSQYSTIIANAANNWVYTGCGYNKLWPNTRVYDITGTGVDFHTYTESGTVLARTSMFNRTNGTTGDAYQVSPSSTDWLYSDISINKTVFDTVSDYNKQGTIVHEFGHAWGLAHNNTNSNSVMCQLGSGRTVNTVQQVDNDAFNTLY